MRAGKDDREPTETGFEPTSSATGNPYPRGSRLAAEWGIEYWLKRLEETARRQRKIFGGNDERPF